MKKYFCSFIILFLICAPLGSGCDCLLTRAYSQEAVTFVVSIPVENFSQDAVIKVRLWDSEQLKISEINSGCSVSFDMRTRTETYHCPGGAEYQEPNPEEFEFFVGDISSSIEIISATVNVGEKYRLLISGRSNDNCNSTSAAVRKVADSEIITIEKLFWSSTMMACP